MHLGHILVCRLMLTPTAPHSGHTIRTMSEQWIRLARISTARTLCRAPHLRSISAAAKAAPRKLASRVAPACFSASVAVPRRGFAACPAEVG